MITKPVCSLQVLFRSLLLGLILITGQSVQATGITADAGLTPPVDRWIFRSQIRYMESSQEGEAMGREMSMYATPVVLAYGVRPNVTIMARQIFFRREMTMMGNAMKEMTMMGNTMEESGAGDFFVLTKWRLLRLNRSDFIVGIAPTVGIEVPTGDSDFGSDSWDIVAGTYVTLRRGPWGADLNMDYKLNGVDHRGGDREGDEFSANLALAYQFTLDDAATMSLWPVVELSYSDSRRDRVDGVEDADSGSGLLQLSPGIKFARQSFMLEALVQIPLEHDVKGSQPERDIAGLLGLRYMF